LNLHVLKKWVFEIFGVYFKNESHNKSKKTKATQKYKMFYKRKHTLVINLG